MSFKETLKSVLILWSPTDWNVYKIVFVDGLELKPGDALVLNQGESLNKPFTVSIERKENEHTDNL